MNQAKLRVQFSQRERKVPVKEKLPRLAPSPGLPVAFVGRCMHHAETPDRSERRRIERGKGASELGQREVGRRARDRCAATVPGKIGPVN